MQGVVLSISIVIYDLQPQELEACLQSVEKAISFCADSGRPIDWQVTLVDNGKNSELATFAKHPRIRLISNSRNKGFGSAHNQVICQSRSDWHLILNADVELDPAFFFSTLALADQEEQVVMIGPHGRDAQGQETFLCKRFPSLLVLAARGFLPTAVQKLLSRQLAHYAYQDLSTRHPSIGIQLLSGCCALARTGPLKAIGGFDEKYFLYFEDFDLSIRMTDHGSIAYHPDANILHHGGNTAAKGIRHIWYFVRSACRFFFVHRHYRHAPNEKTIVIS